MAPAAVATGTQRRSNIRVSLAENGGWIVTVERDGQPIATEHHTDWHRVERRVAVLESSGISNVVGIAAVVLLIVWANLTTLGAQVPPVSLLPEPGIITTAVDLVTGFTEGDASGPKDGLYAHTGQMITGAGWLSLGPGYRRHLLRGHAVADVSTALSWRGHKTAQARVELPWLADDPLRLARLPVAANRRSANGTSTGFAHESASG